LYLFVHFYILFSYNDRIYLGFSLPSYIQPMMVSFRVTDSDSYSFELSDFSTEWNIFHIVGIWYTVGSYLFLHSSFISPHIWVFWCMCFYVDFMDIEISRQHSLAQSCSLLQQSILLMAAWGSDIVISIGQGLFCRKIQIVWWCLKLRDQSATWWTRRRRGVTSQRQGVTPRRQGVTLRRRGVTPRRRGVTPLISLRRRKESRIRYSFHWL